jgi:TfoX/Sxy family transcriptional regulator of competence genes
MGPPKKDAGAAFEGIVAAFARDPRVTPPAAERGAFGSNGLKVDGKIFAMLVRGSLVLKLPREVVEALVASGRGEPFETGGGRVMKEWVVIRDVQAKWLELAREAHAFVDGGGKTARKRSQK